MIAFVRDFLQPTLQDRYVLGKAREAMKDLREFGDFVGGSYRGGWQCLGRWPFRSLFHLYDWDGARFPRDIAIVEAWPLWLGYPELTIGNLANDPARLTYAGRRELRRMIRDFRARARAAGARHIA